MNVLITGGAGYIGSHTCKLLAKNGHVPIAYDNLVYGHRSAVLWGPLEEGDIAEVQKLLDVIRRHKIEAVIHFAAFAYVGESIERPDKYYKNNVAGSLSLFTAMKEAGIKRIVFSSTCATYGNPVQVPMSESHPQQPINPYGMSKLMVERILQDFSSAFGFQVALLRYFNASGADAEGQIGENHDPETHLIPLALKVASDQLPVLTVFGNDYPTPDGTCIRDYIHVADLASAHLLALKYLEKSGGCTAFNLGIGKGFTVKEVIASVERVTGKKLNIRQGARRPGDPPSLVADSSKAQKELGWRPQFTEIDRIVETAWNWERKG